MFHLKQQYQRMVMNVVYGTWLQSANVFIFYYKCIKIKFFNTHFTTEIESMFKYRKIKVFLGKNI